MSVIRLPRLEANKLVYGSKLSNTKHGLDNYYISYGDAATWPRVQFPWMNHPFDTMNDKFNRGDGAKDMLLSFDTSDGKHEIHVSKLKEIDEAVLAEVEKRGWVKPDQIMDWHPSLKERDGKYFNIKFKLPKNGEGYRTTVIDASGKEVDMAEELKPRCRVQVIARPTRVYVRKGQVGLLWEALTMRVKQDESRKRPEFIEEEE